MNLLPRLTEQIKNHSLRAALPFAITAVAALTILGPGLVAERTPLLRDLLLFFNPWTDYLVRRIHAGELPLWNPLVSCGMSIAGQIHNRIYYPGFLFYLALPFRIAAQADLFVHVSVGGVLAALFLRRLGVDRSGAALGSVVFALNGWVLAKMEAPLKIGILTFLPLALLAFLDAGEGRTRRAAALIAMAVGGQLLSGYPPIAVYAIALELVVGAMIFLGSASRTPPHGTSRRRPCSWRPTRNLAFRDRHFPVHGRSAPFNLRKTDARGDRIRSFSSSRSSLRAGVSQVRGTSWDR